jgi:hypothetical protein
VRVTITFSGLTEAIERITKFRDSVPKNIEKQVELLSRDTKAVWSGATPRRTGRLAAGNTAPATAMGFTLENGVFYYDFVDFGHQTPIGWHTKRGYRQAKRRSHVASREMTRSAVQFIEENIVVYLSKVFDE